MLQTAQQADGSWVPLWFKTSQPEAREPRLWDGRVLTSFPCGSRMADCGSIAPVSDMQTRGCMADGSRTPMVDGAVRVV
jgi:hypothetical protein